MAYGFLAKNSNNNILVSDISYNLTYYGKANFSRQFESTVGWNFNAPGTSYTCPSGGVMEYTIFVPIGEKVVPFVYTPETSKWASVANIKYVGTTCTISIVLQGPAPSTANRPTIYCFKKNSVVSTSGWGINIFDSAGNIAFSSKDNLLIINSIYNALTPASQVGYYRLYSQAFGITTQSRNTATAPINTLTTPVAKAAVFYTSYASTSAYSSQSGSSYYFESCARYNYSTRNIEVWWMLLPYYSGLNVNVPARDELAIVIDGSLYD